MTFVNDMEIMNSKVKNGHQLSNKSEIIQHYTIIQSENPAYNDKLINNFYKIEISLTTLLLRKNMAFKKIWKKINYYFTLEFLCVILQEQGLWKENLCNNGSICI